MNRRIGSPGAPARGRSAASTPSTSGTRSSSELPTVLQAAIYVADWGYREDPGANEHGFFYQTSALEAIYNLTNPTTDLLGSALYGEVRGGPEEFEPGSKIILQKNLGRFVIAYNGTWKRSGKETAWRSEGENSLSLSA